MWGQVAWWFTGLALFPTPLRVYWAFKSSARCPITAISPQCLLQWMTTAHHDDVQHTPKALPPSPSSLGKDMALFTQPCPSRGSTTLADTLTPSRNGSNALHWQSSWAEAVVAMGPFMVEVEAYSYIHQAATAEPSCERRLSLCTDSNPPLLLSGLRTVTSDLYLTLNYQLNDKCMQKLLCGEVFMFLSVKCLPIEACNIYLSFSLAFGLPYKHITSFCRIFIIIKIPHFCSTREDECKTKRISNKCIHGDQTAGSKAQHREWKLAIIEATPSKFQCNRKGICN